MEKVLERMARQLNAYDEASLMSLWEQYRKRVEDFEPTQRWEESVLIYCLIQSVRMKNQLFNAHWAELQELENGGNRQDESGPKAGSTGLRPAPRPGLKQRGKVLRFRTAKDDESL